MLNPRTLDRMRAHARVARLIEQRHVIVARERDRGVLRDLSVPDAATRAGRGGHDGPAPMRPYAIRAALMPAPQPVQIEVVHQEEPNVARPERPALRPAARPVAPPAPRPASPPPAPDVEHAAPATIEEPATDLPRVEIPAPAGAAQAFVPNEPEPEPQPESESQMEPETAALEPELVPEAAALEPDLVPSEPGFEMSEPETLIDLAHDLPVAAGEREPAAEPHAPERPPDIMNRASDVPPIHPAPPTRRDAERELPEPPVAMPAAVPLTGLSSAASLPPVPSAAAAAQESRAPSPDAPLGPPSAPALAQSVPQTAAPVPPPAAPAQRVEPAPPRPEPSAGAEPNEGRVQPAPAPWEPAVAASAPDQPAPAAQHVVPAASPREHVMDKLAEQTRARDDERIVEHEDESHAAAESTPESPAFEGATAAPAFAESAPVFAAATSRDVESAVPPPTPLEPLAEPVIEAAADEGTPAEESRPVAEAEASAEPLESAVQHEDREDVVTGPAVERLVPPLEAIERADIIEQAAAPSPEQALAAAAPDERETGEESQQQGGGGGRPIYERRARPLSPEVLRRLSEQRSSTSSEGEPPAAKAEQPPPTEPSFQVREWLEKLKSVARAEQGIPEPSSSGAESATSQTRAATASPPAVGSAMKPPAPAAPKAGPMPVASPRPAVPPATPAVARPVTAPRVSEPAAPVARAARTRYEGPATTPAPPASSPSIARAVQETPAESLGGPARTFLKPLVGIDPALARVRSGPRAAEAAAAMDADALAVGGDILMPESGADTGSPESLGLLAHELTHVARRAAPTFVPPVVRAEASESGEGPGRRPPAPGDEEGVALATERAVRERARGVPRPADKPAGSDTGRPPREPHEVWGTLPAPWEPIPGIDSGSQPDGGAYESAGMGAGGRAGSPPSARALASTPAPVHAAQRGRDSDGESGGGGAGGSGGADASGADVDKLARQVYDVLRRRLLTERERAK